MNYDEELALLKQVREEAEDARQKMRDMVDSVKSSSTYKVWENIEAQRCSEMGEIEDRIRRHALADFLTTGNKHVWDNIEVKEFPTLAVYDSQAMLEWAKKEARHLLVVDEGRLMGMIDTKFLRKVKEIVDAVPGVRFYMHPRVQLARNIKGAE